jgi:hypothetical protein
MGAAAPAYTDSCDDSGPNTASKVKVRGASVVAAGVYGADAPGSLPKVIWLVDLQAACSLAAALSMLPPAVADEAVAQGILSDALLENFQEVMNIGASLMRVSEGRLKLKHVFVPPQVPPSLAAEWVGTARSKLEVYGGVQGFEQGRMYFLAA